MQNSFIQQTYLGGRTGVIWQTEKANDLPELTFNLIILNMRLGHCYLLSSHAILSFILFFKPCIPNAIFAAFHTPLAWLYSAES